MMIEEIVVGYLTSKGYTVYGEEPEKPPQTYAVIGKVGSDEENYISRALITVRSYAPTLLDAAKLNKQIKHDMLYGLLELPQIVGVRLNSDYNNTDPETKRYRYQAVFDITYYEEYEE